MTYNYTDMRHPLFGMSGKPGSELEEATELTARDSMFALARHDDHLTRLPDRPEGRSGADEIRCPVTFRDLSARLQSSS